MSYHRLIRRTDARPVVLTETMSERLSLPDFARERTAVPPSFRRALEICGRVLAALALAFAVLVVASYFQLSQAQEQIQEHAQDHNHPAADAPIHEKFYSTWMMPNNPDLSCCNKRDCYPTEVRFRDGFWEARRREDGLYIRVPWEKVEQRRDNPDGRNHVCMPPPTPSGGGRDVYCFALGGGT